jgi:quinoprotein glucose dehydrogenase
MLVRVEREGREIDAVVQLTKTGLVFVLDRETGTPLFPIEERAVPPSNVPGEQAWPTQPFPVKPLPLVPHHLREDDLWDADAGHLEHCKKKLRKLRNEGIFTPPSETGSILYPGATGGANWSGGAFDPASRMLYVPVNNLAMWQTLTKLPDDNFENTGGRPLHGGLSGLWWALTGRGTGLRYSMIERQLLWNDGVMCNKPPWGTMAAVDLNSGDIRWQVPVGKNHNGVRGLFNLGPPLVTAGGLVFHGGTADQRLWVYDARTGEVLVTFELPAGLHAGPITYKLTTNGKQYLVIAPGGHAILGSKLGDYVIAYVLPE